MQGNIFYNFHIMPVIVGIILLVKTGAPLQL